MKNTRIALVVIALLGIGAYSMLGSSSTPSETPGTMAQDNTATQPTNDTTSASHETINTQPVMEDGTLDATLPDTTTPTVQTYTLAQVSTHNSEQNCWSAVNGNVYNLTSWISQHPGGDRAILKICGSDGSSAFNGQHGDNVQAQTALKEFYIGTLVQ